VIGTFSVQVKDGRTTKVEGLDEVGKAAIEANPSLPVPTLSEVLAAANAATAAGAETVDIQRDSTDGHPRLVKIDPDKNALDDETCFSITDLVVG
jgi:Family of unknown function (DUF6174)